jgi:ABC-type transporter Mla maintaining outer membrane lipid asymmetry ATPase subunit MlaF
MKKRVALARAIVTDTSAGANAAEQVIMYDEPTAGLDPVASTVIEDLIRSMHDPKYAKNRVIQGSSRVKSKSSNSRAYDNEPVSGVSSYIVVTHQHSTIRRSVDRIIFLHGGKVVWEGDIKEFDTTSEPIVRQFASGSLEGPIVYV